MDKSMVIEKISEMKRQLDAIERNVAANENKEVLKYDFVIEDITMEIADKISQHIMRFVQSFKLEVDENNQIEIEDIELDEEAIKDDVSHILRNYIHEPR
jgi:hypothetical protein